MHPCLSVISLTCLFATPLLFPNIFRTIQYELSKICWSLLEVIRLRGDSQQTSDRLTLNPTAEICWRWHQVLIWRAVQISSPNLESFSNQPTKFGYHQTPDGFLTDSWLTPDWLLIDSWLTPDWLLTDSWPNPDWLLTDSQQTSDRLTLNPTALICWRWHQVSIWRAIKISSPNLKSFLNQLYKSGYNQTPIRVLRDTQRTPDWHPTDSGLQKEDSRVWGLLSDRHTSNPKTVCLASLITGKLLECFFCFLTLSKKF